ncbi:unnamed protein product [Caenorhabditis angaria]|uniref:SCP domain-containing protein n=1 Tax=Caenorhabditis angaria TaxID=860376 RepID=A0A9P1N146_9PELO|nr:unnamed protein product [Caenorhabditis angaria]
MLRFFLFLNFLLLITSFYTNNKVQNLEFSPKMGKQHKAMDVLIDFATKNLDVDNTGRSASALISFAKENVKILGKSVDWGCGISKDQKLKHQGSEKEEWMTFEFKKHYFLIFYVKINR